MTLDVQTQIERLAVVVRPVADLVPYAKNSRTHEPHQIDALARMIREFGFTAPVLLDGENGVLAGHGRIMAAKRLGLKRIPTIDLSHLTEEQRQAYVIADNKIAVTGTGWDTDTLMMELGELAEIGYDLTLTGWSKGELDRLMGEEMPGKGGLLDEGADEPGAKAPAMTVPLLLELPRGLYTRWKTWRGDKTDLQALEAALDQLEAG